MEKLLERKHIPTAVLAFNDTAAVGSIRTINDNGLNVPKDISLIGFDDIELCSFVTPWLATVHFPKYKMGEVAVELLLRKILIPVLKESVKKVLPLK